MASTDQISTSKVRWKNSTFARRCCMIVWQWMWQCRVAGQDIRKCQYHLPDWNALERQKPSERKDCYRHLSYQSKTRKRFFIAFLKYCFVYVYDVSIPSFSQFFGHQQSLWKYPNTKIMELIRKKTSKEYNIITIRCVYEFDLSVVTKGKIHNLMHTIAHQLFHTATVPVLSQASNMQLMMRHSWLLR